jgi:hypothetical protein
MTNPKPSQHSKPADILPASVANDRTAQQHTGKKRRKNLWGYYVDATPEEKAQRWRSTNPATEQVPRDLSSYTAYERYLLDETPAADDVEDADIEEARNTINREVQNAETDSAEAAREAREEQAKRMHEEDAREAKTSDVCSDGAMKLGCVRGESDNWDCKDAETDMEAFVEDIVSVKEVLQGDTVPYRTKGGHLGR